MCVRKQKLISSEELNQNKRKTVYFVDVLRVLVHASRSQYIKVYCFSIIFVEVFDTGEFLRAAMPTHISRMIVIKSKLMIYKHEIISGHNKRIKQVIWII